MPSQTIAKRAFARARTYYEGGLKSSNKMYDVDNAPWYKRWFGGAERRNRNRPLAGQEIGIIRGHAGYQAATRIQKGGMLYGGGNWAGNCDELTNIACYLAHQLGAPANELFAASLTAPADHVFCLYGDAALVPRLDGIRVRDLAGMPGLATAVLAIDPWANAWCPLNEYPAKATAKMRKWLRDGKRIYWHDGPLGAGFYATSDGQGEYATEFQAARLVVAPAN
jgi:hypothetical protein